MKRSKRAAVIILLAGLALSAPAFADPGHGGGGHMGGPPHGNGGFHEHGHNHDHFHGHSSSGIFFSVPLGAPWYYGAAPSYYYSYPPLAAAPATPPVYIWPGSEQPQYGYWYYCGAPQGYYPYIQQCNMVWQQVPAQPPAQ